MQDEISAPSWSSRLKTGNPIVRNCTTRKTTLRHANTSYNWEIFDRNSDGSLVSHSKGEGDVTAGLWLGAHYMHPYNQSPEFNARLDSLFPYTGDNIAVVRSRLFQEALNQLASTEMLAAVSIAEYKKTLESCKRLGTLVPRMDDFLYRNKHMLFTKKWNTPSDGQSGEAMARIPLRLHATLLRLDVVGKGIRPSRETSQDNYCETMVSYVIGGSHYH